jgi:hypothetical protein
MSIGDSSKGLTEQLVEEKREGGGMPEIWSPPKHRIGQRVYSCRQAPKLWWKKMRPEALEPQEPNALGQKWEWLWLKVQDPALDKFWGRPQGKTLRPCWVYTPVWYALRRGICNLLSRLKYEVSSVLGK